MEFETYHQLFRYLTQLTYPPNLTSSQQLAIQKQAQHYFIQNQQLYRRNRKQSAQLLLIVKSKEVERILHNIYNEIFRMTF
ncbi:11117_t:CDS:1, partial [Funneliformis geosporum]